MIQFKDASLQEINEAVIRSQNAFIQYRKKNLAEKAQFLKSIAIELESIQDELVATANTETNLGETRLA